MPLVSKPTARRVSLAALAALATIAACATAINAWRLGADFDRAGEAMVRNARAVAARAGPGYERRALESVGRGALSDWFQRLDVPDALSSRSPHPTAESRPDGGVIWSLEFDSDAGLISRPPGADPPRVRAGVLRATGPWPASVTHLEPTSIPVDEIGEIHIAVRESTSPQLVLAWSSEEAIPEKPVEVIGSTPTVAVDLVPGGGPRVYVVDARALRYRTPAGATIRRFFLCPVTADGGHAEIDYVRVVSRVGRLSASGVGRAYERIAGDLRHVVYAAGSRELVSSVPIPATPTRLRFGLAALGAGTPVRVGIRVEARGFEKTLFDDRVYPGRPWRDVEVDLSRFAGTEARPVLWSEAAPGQVVLWANPVVESFRRKPLNVIVYLEDTLRADHLSALGYSRDTSPVKRAFASDAVVFEHAIAQATVTRPSVVSLMTSLPPSATGVVRFWERLGEGYLTLAEILRHRGFTTVAMLQNPNGGAPAGLHQGFERSLSTEVVGTRPGPLVDTVLIPWLRRHADRNCFVYVHVLDPHGPYEPQAPDDDWARSVGGESPADLRIARYDGEIRHADRHFARLLQALDDLDLARQTVLVYLSDHGEYLGEEGRWGHRPPGDLAVVHVPLMIRYPAGLGGGRRVATPVQLLDVVPTLLELLEVDARELALSGRSLVRLARSGRDPALETRTLVSEEPSDHPIALRGHPDVTGSLFAGGWQFQRSRSRRRRPWHGWPLGFRVSDTADGSTDLLFSLDLWTRHRHAALIRAWQAAQLEIRRSLSGPGSATVALDPEANERLRALGYIP